MYKPPQNCNRVKSIKSKFESIENENATSKEYKKPSSLKSSQPKLDLSLSLDSDSPAKPCFSRQFSDPLKRNVKRSPAFRLDLAHENQKSPFETKVKQFSSVKGCESKTLTKNASFVHAKTSKTQKTDDPQSLLVKSKSSIEFQYVVNKRKPINTQQDSSLNKSPVKKTEEIGSLDDSVLQNIDLSLLYTEPIPKCLRNKPISDQYAECPKQKLENNIYNKSTLRLTDSDKKQFLETLKRAISQDLPVGLTDSLRVALRKPLPVGPAPEKPPRTFQHATPEPAKNGIKKTAKRSDPKYMLNKLEVALKNNKLKTRQQQKAELSATSGEDSDDSLLFRSKSCRLLPKPPVAESVFSDLNCFNSLGCTNPAYERIREPNSLFFVDNSPDPIYAEPIRGQDGLKESGKANRNSLYYMSTSLIGDEMGQGGVLTGIRSCEVPDVDGKMFGHKADSDQLSGENSSLSSFASDVDCSPSADIDDTQPNIRHLIRNFESRRQTLPSIQKGGGNHEMQERLCTTPTEASSRVEMLKNSLKLTIDKSFSSNLAISSPRDSDSEKNEEGKVARMVERFHTFQKTAPKYQQPKINKDTLFYCCLVVERVRDCAQIKFKFPPHVNTPKDIEHLCFPENPDSPPLEGTSSTQAYTLLITSETGDRTYGYCRRVLPEGSAHCLPLAYCILSKYKSPKFYQKILLELESRHGMQDKFRDELISQFYQKKFPKPGESISIDLSGIEGESSNALEDSTETPSYIHVVKSGDHGILESKNISICVNESCIIEHSLVPSYVLYEGTKAELVVTLHPDSRYEDAELKKLHKLPPDILLKIFSSLLLERKVILISSVISELSSCVGSLQSILYPFVWYHTLIPILPESLWDIVESPTPVICGVLSAEAIEDRHIENGIVVNIDTKTVLVEEGDEMKILSNSLHKVWRQFITLANNTKTREYVYSVYLADAYLYVFICCFKNYKQYVVDGKFLKDEMVKNAKSKGVRRFLKMFTETCMFEAFMDAALNNPETLAAFDKKIEMYGSDESRTILDKLIEWHR